MKLRRVSLEDNSSITVTYEYYAEPIWVWNNRRFKTEEEAKELIEEINKDFQKRLISVEKRTIVYEKFTN